MWNGASLFVFVDFPALARAWVGSMVITCASLISFLRFVHSGSAMCSLTFELYDRASMFAIVVCIALVCTCIGPGAIHCVSVVSFFAFCTLGICHISTSVWALGRFFLVSFCGLCNFGLERERFDDHCVCRSKLMFVFYTFGICHLLADIWPLKCPTFVCFLIGVVLMRTWLSAIIPGHVSLIIVFLVMFSISVTYLLTVRYCKWSSCDYNIFCCRRGTWTGMDARCWSFSGHSTDWTTMRPLWTVSYLAFFSLTVSYFINK